MKNYLLVFIIIISSIITYADLPVDIQGNEIITDRFWSSREDNFWHGGIDLPSDTFKDNVYSINAGIAYWVMFPHDFPDSIDQECWVGIGSIGMPAIYYGHTNPDSTVCPDTVKVDTVIHKSVEVGQLIGMVNAEYPHTHLEYIEKAIDTLDWGSNCFYLKEPMEYYFHNDYSSNLQTPQFFWLNTDDIGDETKIGRFIPKGDEGTVLYFLISSKKEVTSFEFRVTSCEKKHRQSIIQRNKNKRPNRSIEIAELRSVSSYEL